MSMKKSKGSLAIGGILFVLCIVFYKDVIFSTGRLISYWHQDTYRFVYTLHHLTFSGALQGLRLWNPYIFMGMPLATHPAYPLFYPLDVIFFFLPLNVAMNYSFIINTFLSGLAMYAFVRYLGLCRSACLIAAIVYSFNAVVFLHTYAGHLQTLQTLPWIPLFFLCIERYVRRGGFRTVVAGGVVFGIQLLAGNAQFSFYTALGGVAYGMWMLTERHRSAQSPRQVGPGREKGGMRQIFVGGAALAGMVAIACAIAAVKLIPSLEFMRFSDRNVTQSTFVGISSYYSYDLLTYLFPELYGDILGFPHWSLAPNGFWEMCAYMGVFPLVLSLIAVTYKPNRATAFFSCAAVIAVFASLGPRTPLFNLFSWVLPGFTKFRVHARFVVLVVFFAGVLSAYGMHWLMRDFRRSRQSLKRFCEYLGLCVGAATAVSVLLHFRRDYLLPLWALIWPPDYWQWGFIDGSFSYALYSVIKFTFFLACAFFLVLLLGRGHIGRKTFALFTCALVAVDLWAFSGKYVISAEVDKWCRWDSAVVDFLKSRGPLHTFRVVSMDEYDFFPNKGIMDGIHMVDGYDAIAVQRREDYFKLWSPGGFDLPHNLRLLSINNLRFAVAKKEARFENPSWKVVYGNEKIAVWENLQCLPRISLVHGMRYVPCNNTSLLNLLSRPFIDPLCTVLLEEEPPIATGQERRPIQEGESVRIAQYRENEVTVDAHLTEPGFVVLSDIIYPGWVVYAYNRATGERSRQACRAVNYLFRGIGLAPGDYRIRFAYEPFSFYAGLWVSSAALLFVCIVLCRRRPHTLPGKHETGQS